MQRTTGLGEITLTSDGGAARLVRLYQEGAAKLRLPNSHTRGAAQAVLINTAGGLTGGDQIGWRAEVGGDARLTLATQACERIYRSIQGPARIKTALVVKDRARLNWLPQETILFEGSALSRTLDVELDEGASLLAVESHILGRKASGEIVKTAAVHDRWRIRQAGRWVFADDLRLEGDIQALTRKAAVFSGGAACATIVLLDPDADQYLGAARAIIDHATDVVGGVSAFAGKLNTRIVAKDGQALRRVLTPLLEGLSGGCDLPRVWTL
jgi:urease accessory protein